MTTRVPLDTSADAALVQQRAYAAMDGFQRMRVAAGMRSRVLKLLQLRYSEPEAIVLHMFRYRMSAEELDAIVSHMRRRAAAVSE